MNIFKIKKDNSIKVASTIVPVLDSSFCYVPIINQNKSLVSPGDYIFKNQVLYIDNDDKEVSSPISGILNGINKVNTYSGEVDAYVIENDFHEKTVLYKGNKNNYASLTNKKFKEIVSRINIPVFDDINLTIDFSKKYDILVINGADLEPYVANNSILLTTKLDELMEAVDYLSSVLKVNKTFIVVNSYETDIIYNIINNIGTYPNIELKLIENKYPIIIKNIFSEYNNDKMFLLNISTLNAIDYILKKEVNVSEKLITLSGNGIEEPKVILVKLGSKLNEILDDNIKIKKNKKIEFIVNGLMSGKRFNDLNIIVTNELSSVIFNEKVTFKPKDCLDCGACVRVCPIKNNPKYVKENPNTISSKKQIEACLNCNACSYVCPANTNFKEVMKVRDENE